MLPRFDASANRLSCPTTCDDCPGYHAPNPRTLWAVVLALSITSPCIVVLCLPFLRDGAYRLASSYRDVCGAAVPRPTPGADADGVELVQRQDEAGLLAASDADLA